MATDVPKIIRETSVPDVRTGTPKLEIMLLEKTYRQAGKEVPVLDIQDLRVERGEFVTVIGPSGCGKSTLFDVIAGVKEASGTILLDGKPADRRGRCGYMLQQPLLLPWRTVEENVMLGLDVRGIPRKQARQEARALLARFGLIEFAQNYPATLSGGMRQRVALLRTVLFNADFLLLDEPFGALDALTRLHLHVWLLNLISTFAASTLLITHDIREAILLSDRIYVLSRRPARILHKVTVPLPRPRTPGQLALQDAILLEQEVLGILLEEQSDE